MSFIVRLHVNDYHLICFQALHNHIHDVNGDNVIIITYGLVVSYVPIHSTRPATLVI